MAPGPWIEAFWPFYLRQHRHPLNRHLHHAGTIGGLALLVAAATRRDWRLAAAAPVLGYGLAWLGHVAVERNAPATFTDPPRSFVCDLRMLLLTVAGRMDEEFARQGIAQLGPGAARSPARHRAVARLEHTLGVPERPELVRRSLPARLAAAIRPT
jgi:hypothetical protein